MKLEILDVSKSYNKGKLKALDRINLKLKPGVYGLLGPNGAGKSTLINILVGNLRAEQGKVLFNGNEIHSLGKQYREVLGYMPQQQGLYDDFTGHRFLWYMAALKGIRKKVAAAAIEKLLEVVNLHEHANKRLGTYSGGMKQRILIAQALLNDPEVLILDEPTAGLDPKERIRIRNFISTIALNKIVIVATHVVTDIEFIATEVIMLNQGNVVVKGEPSELLATIQNYVFEVRVNNLAELEQLQQNYKISNIVKDNHGICARVVSEQPPFSFKFEKANPNLEDLYLYYFN